MQPDLSSSEYTEKIRYLFYLTETTCVCTAYPASDTFAEIILPDGMYPENGLSKINIGYLHAGETSIVSWNVTLETDGAGSNISVKAGGNVSGVVPDVIWPGIFYGAYDYTDHIGGESIIKIS